jgi:hypothetical protein
MALQETIYGKVCPLGKFHVDIPGGGGSYTSDPVEACFKCNFADHDSEGFDLEKICQCPEGMTWPEYDKLRAEYFKTEGKHTKKGFREYVAANFQAV